MKRAWIVFALGLLMPFALQAQAPATAAEPLPGPPLVRGGSERAVAEVSAAPQSTARFEQGLLWKVSAPGKAASFVFGTLHISDEAVLNLPRPVEEAFEASRTLVGEVRLVGMNPVPLQLAMLSVKPELPTLLGESDWALVDAQLALRQFPQALRAHLQPWAVLVMLLKPAEGSAGEVLDGILQKRAALAGKKVVGLETAEEQLGVLSGLPMTTQIVLLREALTTLPRLAEETAAITRLYLAGDLQGAWNLHLQTRSQAPEVRALQDALSEVLISGRNRTFVERMKPLLDEGGVFVAVGALHLHGGQGVPALLEAKGFAVERVY